MSKTLEFKVFCIEAYKREKNLNGYQIMDLFEKYGVLDIHRESYGPVAKQKIKQLQLF